LFGLVHANDSSVYKCTFDLLVYSVCFSLQLNHSRVSSILPMCVILGRGQEGDSYHLFFYGFILTFAALRVFFVLFRFGCVMLKVWLKVQLLISLLALSVFH